MELSDQRLLRAAQSRTVTLGEFNFDNLTARPLMSILDMNDIAKLESIATSIRFAGNPKKKKKEIQQIMAARGFDPAYLSGTNRVTYKYYDDPSIVVKVAIDDVGRQDNPREFFNQNVLKPFVTKVFEVAGDGVVALTERVKPIQSREEFLSIADDVHKIIWLLTKRYIIADFGSQYYMNWGIRQGWGPVLLDSPYVYDPTREMLICHAINPNTGNECGGLIDYDEGFNSLICTKCGAVYRASEIAKILKENEIIVKAKERGNIKMRVGIVRGGNKVITLDTTNAGTGIIRPTTENIIVPQQAPVVPEVAPVKTVRVNINTALEVADDKRKNRPNTGKVSIKRSAKKHENNHGGYNKARNNFNGSEGRGPLKVKVSRDNNRSNNYVKKEHVPGSKSAVVITAVNIEELANTQFTFSSYDAENGLVFASGRTPSGSDIKIHLDCKDATEFAKELGVERDEPVAADNISTVVMELEQAKKDLLAQEEENISLKTHIEALKESLEASRKTIEAFGMGSDEVDTLKEQLDAALIESEQLKSEIEILKANQPEDKTAELAANEEYISKLTQQCEAQNRTIESLNLNIEARENTIADLNTEVTALKEKLEAVENDNVDLNEKLATVKEKLEDAENDKVLKTYDVSSVEQDKIFMLHADMYNTEDFLSDTEKSNFSGSKHILALKDMYELDDSDEEVEDFVKDSEGKILCISHINGVPIDCIKFEEGTPNEAE